MIEEANGYIRLALPLMSRQNIPITPKNYESFATHSVNMLWEDASIQEIKNVVSEIIDKTKSLGRFGKTI